jgi:hypothetical protein
MNSYQMVLHRPVETAPFFGNYENELGLPVARLLPACRPTVHNHRYTATDSLMHPAARELMHAAARDKTRRSYVT